MTEALRNLRDDYSDELPEEIIHNYGNYKVRRAWWQSLVFALEDAENAGVIPNKFKKEVKKFIKHYASDEFRQQERTTQKDLDTANNMIDKIVGKKGSK